MCSWSARSAGIVISFAIVAGELFSTMMRFDRVRASLIECVTNSTVRGDLRHSFWKYSISFAFVPMSNPLNGSSIIIRSLGDIKARAILTRCAMPIDSWCG